MKPAMPFGPAVLALLSIFPCIAAAAEQSQQVVLQFKDLAPLELAGQLSGEVTLETRAGKQAIRTDSISTIELSDGPALARIKLVDGAQLSGSVLSANLTLTSKQDALAIDSTWLRGIVQRREEIREEQPAVAWLEKVGAHFNRESEPDATTLKSRVNQWIGLRVRSVDLAWQVIPALGAVRTKERVSDVAPLARLQHLESVDLSDTTVSDLTPLKNLKQLETLYLPGTPVEDLSPLAELKNLKTLDLVRAKKLKNLAPLAGLKDLREIQLRFSAVVDLSPLGNLQEMEVLGLTTTGVTDLSPLAKWKKLRSLDLSGAKVMDLSPLAKLDGLAELVINDTRAGDLPPLTELKNLKSLVFNGDNLAPARDEQLIKKHIQEVKRALPNCKVIQATLGYGLVGH